MESRTANLTVDKPPVDSAASRNISSGTGVAYGLAAYLTWGLVPIYFKAVASIPALEVLAHRVVWSVVILTVMLMVGRRWPETMGALRNRKTWLILSITTILVATNWFIFIWAVANDLVLQASLGYYINPLISILLGVVFLKERLSRWGMLAVGLAVIGVGYQALQGVGFPYIALSLASLFGVYGLLRKIVRIDAVAGLAVETTLMFPWALGFLIWLGMKHQGAFLAVDWQTNILLAFAGVVTTLPLIWFTKGARRLQLSTMGFLQYCAPSLHLVLAVGVYGEVFTHHHAITFGFIWVALALYSIDAVRSARRRIKVANL